MAKISPIHGGYVYLDIQGTEYRVYYEEAGEGIPLVLMHTAGTDGRLYRHILEDSDITSNFRVLGPDLPFHGKSVPPTSREWWSEEYKLTLDFLFEFMLKFNEAFELNRPVYMGASMGGHLAADLAISHPDKFRAVIGLEAGLATENSAPPELRTYFGHPRMTNETKVAMMYTFMATMSPEPLKREVAFIYGQGSHRVFEGDLNYYGGEHDVSASAKTIDTKQIAVYLLGGDYDWSGTPKVVKALHDEVPGSSYTLMEGLGHFPMSENPELFKSYIMPVFADILSRLTDEDIAKQA